MMSKFITPKFIKFQDIQNIIKHVFDGRKRPSFIQLSTKPKKAAILLVTNNGEINITSTIIPKIHLKQENVSEDSKFIINGLQSQNALIRRLIDLKFNNMTHVYINEFYSAHDIFSNVLKNIKVENFDLSIINQKNLKHIKRNDIYHMFSYSKCVGSKASFDPTLLNGYLRPIKESKYFLLSIDCEMMICEDGKQIGRITMIDNTGKKIYDKYIKPETPVIDYLEKYSGLNEINTGMGISLSKLHSDLLDLIGTNTCIVGHGLENDLEALNFYTENIIDTSYLFLTCDGHKLKLSQLCKNLFKKNIQEGSHSSREDAYYTLKLLAYKMAEILNFYDAQAKSIKTSATIVDNIKNTDEDRCLILSQIDILEMDSLIDRDDLFYIILYSQGSNNYVAMKQRN